MVVRWFDVGNLHSLNQEMTVLTLRSAISSHSGTRVGSPRETRHTGRWRMDF